MVFIDYVQVGAKRQDRATTWLRSRKGDGHEHRTMVEAYVQQGTSFYCYADDDDWLLISRYDLRVRCLDGYWD